jgi:signal peptidase II
MDFSMSLKYKSILLVLVVLVLDQILKIWIKTNMFLGEEYRIAEWFRIHFIENEGMAFGMSFGGRMGKLFLSLFRLVAIGFLGWYVNSLIKSKVPTGLVLSIALIFAGAVGNMIDSAFYGLFFTESIPWGEVATMVSLGNGYENFLFGKVVDMFYFPMIKGNYPEWFPFWGGDYFEFFRPVFNIADSAISVGVVSVLLFYRSHFVPEAQNLPNEVV